MYKVKRLYIKVTRKNIILVIGAVLSLLIIAVALFAPYIQIHNPTLMSLPDKLMEPSSTHPFGTDNMGRDILSRVIAGSRISLSIAFLVIIISMLFGTAVGLMSGYMGGAVDMAFMRIVDILLAFPTIIFALAVSAILGSGQGNIVVAICLVQWTRYARVARGEAVLIKNAEYIEAAHAIGNKGLQIILKYFLPSIIAKIIVLASLDIGSTILYCSSLSFLGLGAQPPSPDWGVMISDGKDYISRAPWMAVFPGLAIALSALAFNLLGDGIRDLLDPRMRESVNAEQTN